MSTTCPARWGKPRRRELSPLPPLMIYQAAQLMDSFEKLNILAGIMTSAAEIKEGQKTFASPEEKQQAQMDEQHAKVMRLFSAIAKALNAGYKFEEVTTIEWKAVTNVARQNGWVGEDKEALEVFKMLDLVNSQYRVRREKLLAQFRPSQRPTEGSEG